MFAFPVKNSLSCGERACSPAKKARAYKGISLNAELGAVRFYGRQVLLELWIVGQEFQYLIQRNDADYRNAEVALHFLNSR